MDLRNLGHFGRDEASVAARGHHRKAAGFEPPAKPFQNFADQAAIAMDSADEHGLFGAFSNNRRSITYLYFWQKRGFFVKVLRHRAESRRDDAPDVVPAAIYNIKGYGRAKIHDHSRGAEECPGRQRIRQTVR